MASLRSLASAGSRLAILMIAAGFLAGSAATTSREATSRPATPVTHAEPWPASTLTVPGSLTADGLDMRAGPVAVPLVLRMPSLGVDAPVVGVGITSSNVMDAPMGPAGDPVWQQAFWYRGSAVPGARSTALIAGHIGGGGLPGVFANLDALRPGDAIVIHDLRDGLDVRFSVTGAQAYSLDQTTDPAVLTEIYGAGPVAGAWAQPSADGLAHLTLITCSGTFRNGTHDHRLVVRATRVG